LKNFVVLPILALLAISTAITAQNLPAAGGISMAGDHESLFGASQSAKRIRTFASSPTPFSRVAIAGGVSPMGLNMQVATNANRFMNLRASGNYFDYTMNNISVSGFNIDGKFNFASAGASLDIYPFPNHGFRLSPGGLFYNHNNVAATVTVPGGTKLTLNGYDYYASSTNPITGNGNLGMNSQNPAFTMTTGWGNMIPRRGDGHWSAPFEIGAAMTGAPTVNMALTGGQACNQNGLNCVDVATDPNVQANLQAQLAKYRSDLNAFRFYPIINFGVAYNFSIRRGGMTR
jgi:hypothetical protein